MKTICTVVVLFGVLFAIGMVINVFRFGPRINFGHFTKKLKLKSITIFAKRQDFRVSLVYFLNPIILFILFDIGFISRRKTWIREENSWTLQRINRWCYRWWCQYSARSRNSNNRQCKMFGSMCSRKSWRCMFHSVVKMLVCFIK